MLGKSNICHDSFGQVAIALTGVIRHDVEITVINEYRYTIKSCRYISDGHSAAVKRFKNLKKIKKE